jgi:hypothetical protein
MEVIAGIFFTDGVTEGFKTSAPYTDMTDSPMTADGLVEGFKTAAPYGDVPCLPTD